MKSLKKGFTLVELMVVIVIIGILAALAIPRFLGATNKTKAAEFKPVLKQIYTLQMAYQQEKGTLANDLGIIGFDPPGSTSRFTYSVPTTIDVHKIGVATYAGGTGKIINDVKGNPLSTSTSKACIDTASIISAADSAIGNLSNLSVVATCS
jgi:prepilin-type N-terminal cleavage/methylation domain-containing protein